LKRPQKNTFKSTRNTISMSLTKKDKPVAYPPTIANSSSKKMIKDTSKKTYRELSEKKKSMQHSHSHQKLTLKLSNDAQY